jgi:hypothetical protein
VYFEGDDEAEEPLDSIIHSFKSCHPLQLRAVTHIHISLLKSMYLKSLATLQDMFPALEVFHLHSSEESRPSGLLCEFSNIPCQIDPTLSFSWIAFPQNLDLTDLFTLSLPNTLVSLSIQWTSGRNVRVESDLVAAKDNLLPRLPYLRRLWLCDLSKRALLWSRTDVRATGHSTLHESE